MTDTQQRHIERVKRVCAFIDANLDETLSLDQLSQVAASSKFHFQRLFSAMMGVSAVKYLWLARLKRASFRLAFEPDRTITDIAFEAHFDSSEAFSRAFLRTFGQSPSQFRNQPQWPQWHAVYEFSPPTIGAEKMDVSIVDFATRQVALIEHRGHPQKVFETAAKFINWRKETGLSPVKTSGTFGIPHSDPNETPAEDFRWDICGTHVGEVPANSYGVRADTIPGGRCAKVTHCGNHNEIGKTVYYLYREWLPNSGESLRDFPVFFHYLNFVHEVDECELRTDVYLPLE